MSRETKFRLWDIDNNEYCQGGTKLDLLWCIEQGFLLLDNDEFSAMNPDRLVIEQNSTYKYKGGTEAYEGDICKYDDRLFEVKWMTTGHGLYLSPLDGSVAFSISFIEDATYVRTIHDKETKHE